MICDHRNFIFVRVAKTGSSSIIKFIFSESVTKEEFSIKLKVVKLLSFLTSFGLKTY